MLGPVAVGFTTETADAYRSHFSRRNSRRFRGGSRSGCQELQLWSEHSDLSARDSHSISQHTHFPLPESCTPIQESCWPIQDCRWVPEESY
jgi:hypothetical protein